MIVTTSKDKQHPYVIIDKSIFDDPNISLQAKGLIIFCRIKFAEGFEFWNLSTEDTYWHSKLKLNMEKNV